jgi:uncharacterized protein (DUF1786 family)
MRILTVDVGTGTQDVFLFDSERELENGFKLVMPSPTVVVADRIREVTRVGRRLLLRGVTMGGGPSHWAAMDHLRAGLPAFATPEAARTFDDDLEAVAEMGFQVVSDDEARSLVDVIAVTMRDLWLDEVLDTFRLFGIPTGIDRLAVAVFDHGAAPPGFSDRVFRFNYLRERLGEGGGLSSFAFARDQVPESLTRLHAVAQTAPAGLPLLLMDTAPAAVLGALEDPSVAGPGSALVVNVGNFHALAFKLADGRVSGLFEHHTGELSPASLERFVRRLSAGSLTNEEVFSTKGHGAAMFDSSDSGPPTVVSVLGPRREMLRRSGLVAHEAVPHGDMMLAGCYGLLRAYAEHDDAVREAVERRMGTRLAA